MPSSTAPQTLDPSPAEHAEARYRRSVLGVTTLGMFFAFVNQSILLISLPAIFHGLNLNPLDAGNFGSLLWLLTGYSVAAAVLVVAGGRLGDVYGRARIFTIGFGIFTVGAILCALTPSSGSTGALELILFRVIQGVGGALLTANSTALLTDAYPAERRGAVVGLNQVAGIGGSFLGLLIGGLLADHSWRGVFWLNVPFGVVGTIWAARSLRDPVRPKEKISLDPLGSLLFGLGLVGILTAMTYGIQPYGGHLLGWTSPKVLSFLIVGIAMLAIFAVIEPRVRQPMMDLRLFRIRAFSMGNLATLVTSLARGGQQFMLIIWLQGIWLPEHGYSFHDTPLWAGIYLLPLTVGFLAAGPLSGALSDRFGARPFATGGMILASATFFSLILLPANFPYPLFALILVLNGVAFGLFASPNATGILNAVPPSERGAANGVRAMLQNAGQVLSIGLFFTLLVLGLGGLSGSLHSGLINAGVPATTAAPVAAAPPIASLFAAFLGFDPIKTVRGSGYNTLSPAVQQRVSSHTFFSDTIGPSFMHALIGVFGLAAVLCIVAAVASWLRGGRYVHEESHGEHLIEGHDIDFEDPALSALPAEPVGDPSGLANSGRVRL